MQCSINITSFSKMDSYQTHLISLQNDNQRKYFLKDMEHDIVNYLISLLQKIPPKKHSPQDLQHLENYKLIVEMIRDPNFSMKMKRYIIQQYSYPFIHIAIKPFLQKKPVRNRRDCPIPGCNTLGLKKLSNHLTNVHPYLLQSERRYWLSKARTQ